MNEPHPDPTHPTVVRKLYRAGHGFALTIGSKWVHAHTEPDREYVTVTLNADGSITIAPLTLSTPAPPTRTRTPGSP